MEIVKPLENCVLKDIPKEIRLEVTFNRVPKAVAWLLNDKPIVPNKHFKCEDLGTVQQLVISAPIEEDAAKYSIVAEKTRSDAHLSFEVAPCFQLPEDFVQDLRKKAGSAHVIEIPFLALPKPKVTWQWKDGNLPDAKRFKVDVIHGMTSLTMSKLKREDSGPFVLSIENPVGKCTFTVNLTVLDKPGPPRNLDVTSNLGVEMTLQWAEPEDNGGCLPLQYIVEQRELSKRIWTDLGTVSEVTQIAKPLIVGKKYSFHVATINEMGQSEFVEIKNPIEAKCSFSVPSEPRNLIVKAVGPKTATVSWCEPEKDGGAPIITYNLELLPENNNDWTTVEANIEFPSNDYTINDLDESSHYDFRLAARNVAGQGPYAKSIEPLFLGEL